MTISIDEAHPPAAEAAEHQGATTRKRKRRQARRRAFTGLVALTAVLVGASPAGATVYGPEGEWGSTRVTCDAGLHKMIIQVSMLAPSGGRTDEPLAFMIDTRKYDPTRKTWVPYSRSPWQWGYYSMDTTFESAPMPGQWLHTVWYAFEIGGRWDVRGEHITSYVQHNYGNYIGHNSWYCQT